MGTSTIRGGFAVTASVGATLLAAAALFDAEPLYVPALTLLLTVLFAVAWVLTGIAGTEVERAIAVRRAMEDEPVEVVVHARPVWTQGAGPHGPWWCGAEVQEPDRDADRAWRGFVDAVRSVA